MPAEKLKIRAQLLLLLSAFEVTEDRSIEVVARCLHGEKSPDMVCHALQF